MASNLLKIAADFETSLASGVSIGATTATLSSITDDDGNVLPNGTYGFTIDNGTTSKEYITATVTSTALTNIKSISRQNAITTGFLVAHRRGAQVIISDWVIIKRMLNLLDGTDSFDSATPMKYTAEPTFTYGNHEFVTWDKAKDYTDSVAIAGAPNMNTTTKGIGEEATAAEIDAGTQTGSTSAELVVNPKYLKDSIYYTQLPSSGEKAGLAGTSGTPGSGNKFVTNDDTSSTPSANKVVRYDGSAIVPGVSIGDYGTGADGDVTISSNTSLSRDMYYNNLTIDSGFSLNPNGYRIFVKGTLTVNGTIKRNGNNGSNGGNASGSTGGTAGAGGTALASGSIAGAVAGGDGGAGANGTNGPTTAGNNAASSNITSAIGSNGAVGGTSGTGGVGGSSGGGSGAGTGGSASTVTNPTIMPYIAQWAINLHTFLDTAIAFMKGSAQGNGGGGASSGNAQDGQTGYGGGGGGGGGAGGTGGIIMISAKIIIISATGVIQSLGGTGGNGGNGGNGNGNSIYNPSGGGTGGGGAGGTGGVIVLVYKILTNSGSISVAGGSAGTAGATPGTGLGTGQSGSVGASGSTGATGVIYQIVN